MGEVSEVIKFEVGERVARISHGCEHGRVVTIEKITPRGRIIAGGETFKASGFRLGGNGFYMTHLVKLTPDRLEAIVRANRLNKIAAFKFSTLADSQLETIINVLANSQAGV